MGKGSSLVSYLGSTAIAILAVPLLFINQIIVVSIMYVLDFDYVQHPGTLQTLYCALQFIVLFILYKLLFRKKIDDDECIAREIAEPYFKRPLMIDKIKKYTLLSVIVIVLALFAVTSLYMLAIESVSKSNTTVEKSLGEYTEYMDESTKSNEIGEPVWDMVLNVLSVSILIPLSEELTFRVFGTGNLLTKCNKLYAILVSAIIFSVAHWQGIQSGYALLAGLLFALVYFWTRNIIYTTIMHGIFNFIGSSYAFICTATGASDYITSSIYSSVFVISMIAIAPAIIAMYYLYFKSKTERKHIGRTRTVLEDD